MMLASFKYIFSQCFKYDSAFLLLNEYHNELVLRATTYWYIFSSINITTFGVILLNIAVKFSYVN